MTPEQLDQELRRLSEHEQLYKRGIDPNQIVPYQSVEESDGIPRSMAISQYNEISGFYIKRHSRFREYPLHRQDEIELAFMYDGSATEIVNGTSFTLRRGQILIVDSNTVHTTLPLGENDILIVVKLSKGNIAPSFFSQLEGGSIIGSFFANSISKGQAHDGYVLFHSENSRRLPLFMNEFLCEWLEPSCCTQSMLKALFNTIVAELANVYESDICGTGHGDNPALEVLTYIEKQYATCSLAEAADTFKMAPDSLSRMLKREAGSSFNKLVQRQRISVAKTLFANTDLPVTAICKQVGYDNISFFYRKFREETGMTPAAYRSSVGLL
ncbi:Arabinose operon regulatory protein [Collinsella aerofaciens]|uniref:Arabinose operon regulatory protein n=1 Tax=Collinsella aerofaciens TaxID=74426 RepID=A0A5K1J1R4_9ACTN|nr:AraC family transcriptional regulator [Collinsella aerofaciens]VWL96541.1 Arabinose operon regulatory protein [Collinsella aerofaciens]VWL99011.1 Arabinose operon regulatory protein [Collinsella aerofaciens]